MRLKEHICTKYQLAIIIVSTIQYSSIFHGKTSVIRLHLLHDLVQYSVLWLLISTNTLALHAFIKSKRT